VFDRDSIRGVLAKDRPWSLYALGDLAPGYFERCTWFLKDSEALVLLYRGSTPPVLFAAGAPASVARLLPELRGEKAFYLHLRPEIAELLAADYEIQGLKQMWRMTLDASRYQAAPFREVRRLGGPDLPALQELYADGEAAGEAPDFFFPEMLEQGVFFGVEEDGRLASVAGTHLVVPAEGVAAVGNIYTRRGCRGRGWGSLVTSAVAGELLRREIPTIGLNVNQQNQAAIRVYEKLGFAKYCAFCEGLAGSRLR
jgi:ribosomal protein S18 acetylase RimI-like enzyme